MCECNCKDTNKNITSVRGSDLKRENVTSCGCYRSEWSSNLHTKHNNYDLSGECGIGYTFKNEPFYFDLEDYDKIKDYCWYLSNEGYVVANIRGKKNKQIKMHILIMDTPKSLKTDHIFGNKNDNRKLKLRIVNSIQNNQNRKLSKHNKTGVPGVCWSKQKNRPEGRWYASIAVNKKVIYLGRFKDFAEAVKVRKEAEQKYFGEYALKIEQI